METTADPTAPPAPLRRFRPTDRDRYIALVLWMHGLSAADIALLLHKTRKSALSIVQKGPYPPRASMSLAERQEALDELWEIRCGEDGKKLDGGLLPARVFKPKPLAGRQSVSRR